MKSNAEIIREIIETARKLERTQIRKDEYQNQPTDRTEKSEKIREQELLDYDFDICTLGEKLNTFIWLFEDERC